jgi:hypothetical protein
MTKFLLFSFNDKADSIYKPYEKFLNNLATNASNEEFNRNKEQAVGKYEDNKQPVNDLGKSEIKQEGPSIELKAPIYLVYHPSVKFEFTGSATGQIARFTADVRKFNYIDQIKNALKIAKENTKDSEKVSIMIEAHGTVIGGEHYLSYNDPRSEETTKTRIPCLIRTKDFFAEIANAFPKGNLEVIFISCFSGMAQKDLDILPKGTKLYTFADEEVVQATAPIRYALENYPVNKGFDIEEYTKLLLNSRDSSNHYSGSVEEQLNSVVPEWVSVGTSGQGSFTYKLNPFKLDNFTKEILPVIRKMKEEILKDQDKNPLSAYRLNEFLKWVQSSMVDLIDRQDLIKLGINPDAMGASLHSDSSNLTKAAMLLDSKVQFQPQSAKYAADIGLTTIALNSPYAARLLHEKRTTLKESLNKNLNIFDIIQGDMVKRYLAGEQNALNANIEDSLEEIEQLARVLDGLETNRLDSGDVKDLTVALMFTKDHTGQRYLTLGLTRKDHKADQVVSYNVKITDEEMLDLLAGKYNGEMFKFIFSKAERIIEETSANFSILLEKLTNGELPAISLKAEYIKSLANLVAHKAEIIDQMKKDSKAKLLCNKFDLCLKKVQKFNALANREIDNDEDLLKQVSKYFSTEDHDVPVRLAKFTEALQYNPGEEEFVEIPTMDVTETFASGVLPENNADNL